jgi:hypothetical protein
MDGMKPLGFSRRRSSILKWKVFKKKILNSEEDEVEGECKVVLFSTQENCGRSSRRRSS